MAEWLRRLWYLLNRRRLEDALQREMEAHRELMGEPVRFGNTLQLRERSRDVWGWAWFDALGRDVRFAARGLRRTPGFTLVATLSLALGLALTTSTVSIVNAYLIRSLPYPESDRLYHVMYAPPGPWEPSGMTALDWKSVADVVEFPISASGESFYVGGGGGYSQALRGMRVTRGFVEGLSVGVATGRRPVAEDFTAGSEPVALLGHALWRDRFGSDPGAIGRLIRAETESRPGTTESFRIVGVLAPGFYFGRDRTAIDLLIPHPAPIRTYMVRLREGVPPAAAERRLTEAARRAATSPIPNDWSGVRLQSARDRWLGSLRPVLLGITVAVSLVLVIVCANVAVLMLLRSMQRQKEVAVRLALGAGWRHIARMFVAETGIICIIAFGAGIAMTAILLGSLSPAIEMQLGRPAPSASGITIDTNVLAIVGGVSLLAAMVLSLVPLTSWGRRVTNALQQDARVATDGRPMRRLRSGLIAFEIAGSLVLLIGCGLMVRSVVRMLNTDLGFEPSGLHASRIMLRARNYPDAAYRSFHERFAASVTDVTGSTVVFSSWPPFVPPPEHLIEPDAGEAGISGGAISVSAGYFSTFGIAITQGREFTVEEASADAPVAVISETLARRLWPAGSALGRRVRDVARTQGGSTPGPWRTVVGIAGDVRQTYDDGDRNDFYMPRTPDGRFGTFYVRSTRPGPVLFDHVQRAAADIDPDAVINPPHLVARDDQALAGTRFLTWMLAGFSAIAALLAMLGMYGVTAYAVQQRRKEVAIRTALGASRRGLMGIFLREGAVLLGVGTAAGLFGGAATSRVLRHQLFGVQPFDASTYAIACALLLAAGFLAVFIAARGASVANPVSALNSN